MNDNKAVKFPELPWLGGPQPTLIQRVLKSMEPGRVYTMHMLYAMHDDNSSRRVQAIVTDLLREGHIEEGTTVDPDTGKKVRALRLKGKQG